MVDAQDTGIAPDDAGSLQPADAPPMVSEPWPEAELDAPTAEAAAPVSDARPDIDDGPVSDARPDVDDGSQCRRGESDSGNACLDKCICDECAMQADACFSNSGCRNLIDCANRSGCADTACAAQKCQGELRDAGQTGLAEAIALAGCYQPKCAPRCAGDAVADGS
jgi:hypothetical protein